MAHSTLSPARHKPAKPRPDFPLFPHASGRWAKKIRGRFFYFGKVADDPKGEAGLDKWLEQRDDLLAGRTPRTAGDGLTVEDLCDHFLNHKRHLIDTRELSPRTFADYFSTCDRLVKKFGLSRLVSDLRPVDFETLRISISKTRGAVALGNEVQRCRSVFRFALEQGLIDVPIRFGQVFRKPKRNTIRKARAAAGSRMLEAAEIRATIDKADVQMKAMILLAANGALGQSDISALPKRAMNLKSGWLDYPREKTGVPRRIPLWPETVKAVQEAIARRPAPKDQADADLVFLTRCGQRWVKYNEGGTPADALGQEFAKLLVELKIKRPRISFYAIRHSWRTVADETRDFPAIDQIMGHTDNSMAAAYRERISDERLVAVCNYVNKWLFQPAAKARKRKMAR